MLSQPPRVSAGRAVNRTLGLLLAGRVSAVDASRAAIAYTNWIIATVGAVFIQAYG
jgi:hypothetical protein